MYVRYLLSYQRLPYKAVLLAISKKDDDTTFLHSSTFQSSHPLLQSQVQTSTSQS